MLNDRIMCLLHEAKKLAQEYRTLTGKPLGITGEIAEYEAARLLNLKLAPAQQAGYDATEIRDGQEWKLPIKGRCILVDSKPGQRIGSIKTDHDWDAVLLVLLDHDLEAYEIWEADREPIVKALDSPGSKARNERGALSVPRFKSLAGGKPRWSRPSSVKQERAASALTET